MSEIAANVQAVGWSHPPTVKPYQRTPDSPVEWHKVDCSVDQGAECPPPGCAADEAPNLQKESSS